MNKKYIIKETILLDDLNKLIIDDVKRNLQFIKKIDAKKIGIKEKFIEKKPYEWRIAGFNFLFLKINNRNNSKIQNKKDMETVLRLNNSKGLIKNE